MAARAQETGDSTSAAAPGSATVEGVTGRAPGINAEPQTPGAVVSGGSIAVVDHGVGKTDIPSVDRASGAAPGDAGGPTAAPDAIQSQVGSPTAAPGQPNGAVAHTSTQRPLNRAAAQSQTGDQAGQAITASRPAQATAAGSPSQDQAGQTTAATDPAQDQASQAITASNPAQDQASQTITASNPAQDQAGQAITTTGPGHEQASAAAGPGRDQAIAAADQAQERADQPNTAAGAAPSESPVARPTASDIPRTTADSTALHSERDAAPGVPDHALAGVAGPAPTATATAPTAPSSAPPAAPPAAQIAMRIMPLRLEADGVHRLTVNLHPADLGPVQVVAEIRNGDVTLQLSGSTDAGTAALRDCLNDLRRELTDSGFGNCSLDLRDGGGGEQPRPQHSSPTRPTPSAERTTVAPEPAAQKAGRLDVRA
jgi:flagellar hook-length control protein FliK